MPTFEVSDVKEPRSRMEPLDRDHVLRGLFQQPIEALYHSDATLVACDNGNQLALAVHEAFFQHRPLVLTPDAVWLCIAGGFASHMSLHAEALRSRFVRHEGRITLVVERPDFVLGRPNPWPEAFAAFSEQIASHVGKARDLVVCDFSTTGPVERAASEVLLMDAFQAYFEYVMMIGCGIPRIHLRGTVEDWRSVRARARMLGEYGLEQWVAVLDPVLSQFERAAQGDVDPSFWRSLFRYESASRVPFLSGWILVLFPYLVKDGALVWNGYMEQWGRYLTVDSRDIPRFEQVGPSMRELPPSLASAPVKVEQAGLVHDMRFVGGMFGVVEDSRDGALAPEFGWAVVYEGQRARPRRGPGRARRSKGARGHRAQRGRTSP
jgi:hypothetical protein